MPNDQAADYADDPADLGPGRLDRMFVRADPLAALYLLLCPCVPLAPAVVVWSLCGVLACRTPVARRNAWLLLIISAAATLFLAGLLVAAHQIAEGVTAAVMNDPTALPEPGTRV